MLIVAVAAAAVAAKPECAAASAEKFCCAPDKPCTAPHTHHGTRVCATGTDCSAHCGAALTSHQQRKCADGHFARLIGHECHACPEDAAQTAGVATTARESTGGTAAPPQAANADEINKADCCERPENGNPWSECETSASQNNNQACSTKTCPKCDGGNFDTPECMKCCKENTAEWNCEHEVYCAEYPYADDCGNVDNDSPDDDYGTPDDYTTDATPPGDVNNCPYPDYFPRIISGDSYCKTKAGDDFKIDVPSQGPIHKDLCAPAQEGYTTCKVHTTDRIPYCTQASSNDIDPVFNDGTKEWTMSCTGYVTAPDDGSGSSARGSGLSDAEIGGIAGGAAAGVLLLGFAVYKLMPEKSVV